MKHRDCYKILCVPIVVVALLFSFTCAPTQALAQSLANPSDVQAVSDSRQGFIIGIGLGIGSTSVTSKATISGFPPFVQPSEKSNTESNTGLISDFKIGHAPSDQLAIFWTAKVAWLLGATPSAYSGVGDIAASYYFDPQAPSPFVSAGLGLTTYTTLESLSKSNSDSNIGFGFFIGGGYEFARHWDVEADLIFGSPGGSSDNSGGIGISSSTSTFTVKITINVLSY